MYSSKSRFYLANENQTKQLAIVFAALVKAENLFLSGFMVYLKGDLGAGKSFFSRAFIQIFAPGERVKSPTYTLVESYEVEQGCIQHLDLYRLCDPEELEFLAIRELLEKDFVALVEWPEKGKGVLPQADMVFNLLRQDSAEEENSMRRNLEISSHTLRGLQIVKKLTEKMAHNLL